MEHALSIEHDQQVRRAVIYCRVSSKKQSAEGSGLDSQEHRCREYAQQRGYQVDAIFPDDVSGGGDFMKRPGMVALLSYLDARPDDSYVVIFDDLKRYARDTEFHLKLKREMSARGATRECLNFKFEDTPEGKFIETVLAAQGQLEREQNGRQVRQKMQARMEQGYWVFKPPVGYRYASSSRGGKQLVHDEPLASIVTEALEGYAVGRFESQAEVKRFLESQPEFPKNERGEVRQQQVSDILSRAIYAGYVDFKDWDISWRQGQHDPLISLATYQKIQQRREGTANAPHRKDIRLDFPLRGFVLCDDCGQPFTSCWSRGKSKKYPYYLCDTRGCPSRRKSIRRDLIEGRFAEVVQSITPKQALFDIAIAMFKDAWSERGEQLQQVTVGLKRELKALDTDIDELVQRIVETSNTTVITAYETKIEQLQQKKLSISDRLRNQSKPKHSFEESIEHAITFLQNPRRIWDSGDFAMKRTVLRLAFSERLAYSRKDGYRTPKTSLPFKVLGDICKEDFKMVEPRGIEPLTSTMPFCKGPNSSELEWTDTDTSQKNSVNKFIMLAIRLHTPLSAFVRYQSKGKCYPGVTRLVAMP